MQQAKTIRDELFIAGVGGMGVLFIGSLLASAAFEEFEYVTWLPSYGVQPRGGLSECTIIFSNEKIASPFLNQTKSVILIDGSQFPVIESRVRPGGQIIVDKNELTDDRTRDDIKVLPIPAIDTAVSVFGQVASANLILFGVYITMSEAITKEPIFAEMERKFGKKEEVLSRNKKAFEIGIELGRTTNV